MSRPLQTPELKALRIEYKGWKQNKINTGLEVTLTFEEYAELWNNSPYRELKGKCVGDYHLAVTDPKVASKETVVIEIRAQKSAKYYKPKKQDLINEDTIDPSVLKKDSPMQRRIDELAKLGTTNYRSFNLLKQKALFAQRKNSAKEAIILKN